MPTPSSYEYAYIRVVPRVERGEFLNVGVILFCRTRRFLAACIRCNRQRLAQFAPELDADMIQEHLDLFPRICAGEGSIGRLGQAEAFHWLVAPHSTIIQTSPVHAGLCIDPQTTLAQLIAAL